MGILFIGQAQSTWKKQDDINKNNSTQWLSKAFSFQHHHAASECLKQFSDCILLFSLSWVTFTLEASFQAVFTSKGHHLLLLSRIESFSDNSVCWKKLAFAFLLHNQMN